MTPLRLSHTWSRRLYVGLFILSFIFVVLFALAETGVAAVPEALKVDYFAAGGAIITLLGSILSFFLVKKDKEFVPSIALYAVFTLTTAYIVLISGGVASPYIALWTLIAFFAPLFGAYGWVSIFALIGVYTAGIYLDARLSFEQCVLIFSTSFLPLVAGMIIWRETPGDTQHGKDVKHLASQLSEVATKSEIVINAIGDGVIALDGKGTIQLINPAAQEILGWGKQDALMLSYKSILKLRDENDKEITPAEDPVEQVLNTNQKARSHKLISVTKSGKKINLAMVVSPIGSPGSGAIAVFRDSTNERAEEREQAEFISTASHEMRTPVASIEGYLGLALNPATAQIDERARDFILKAHEAAQHLGRLFQDLLDVSKSEDGRLTNTPKVVDVVSFASTITQGLSQKATDKGLTLIFAPTADDAQRKIMPVYYVNQDNDHIREIIDNLIENAIKYTPEGKVIVDISGTDEKVIISVTDTGLGIPPEDISHLFQKFYRVNNMDRQQIGGTGLGLYLVRRLAETMQGRVWVESEYKKGSTFFLELPRIDNQEAERLLQTQQSAPKLPTAPKPIPVTDLSTPPAAPAAPTPSSALPTPAEVTQPSVQDISAPQPTPAPEPSQAAPILAPPEPPAPQVAPSPSKPVLARPESDATKAVRPATTVPRGESLSREQIAERVKQLEALAKQQRGAPPPRQ